jgi:hypothetical protein
LKPRICMRMPLSLLNGIVVDETIPKGSIEHSVSQMQNVAAVLENFNWEQLGMAVDYSYRRERVKQVTIYLSQAGLDRLVQHGYDNEKSKTTCVVQALKLHQGKLKAICRTPADDDSDSSSVNTPSETFLACAPST